VTFDQDYDIDPDGLLLQSHSGDGDEGDIVKTAPGPGPCPETTSSSTDTVVVNNNPTTTTTAAPTTTTAAPTTTTTQAPAAETQAVVLGETLTAPVQAAELPRTGSDGLLTLTLAGLSLILAGLACGRLPRLFRAG
jgi:LPXTG-motif cell wall-anchored protein